MQTKNKDGSTDLVGVLKLGGVPKRSTDFPGAGGIERTTN